MFGIRLMFLLAVMGGLIAFIADKRSGVNHRIQRILEIAEELSDK